MKNKQFLISEGSIHVHVKQTKRTSSPKNTAYTDARDCQILDRACNYENFPAFISTF